MDDRRWTTDAAPIPEPHALISDRGLPAGALRGERKLVTVMFADISGFTARCEHLDPEEVISLINACFEDLDGAIAHYEGTIDKFIGDALMVLFGAPVTHEDDAERAVRCALEMQTRLATFGRAYLEERPGAPPLAMHIGINTGVVIAGSLGTRRRRDYTVMGDVVNLASRLESAAGAGQVLIGAATQRLLAPLFRCRPLPPLVLKGKHEPQHAYEVLAPTGALAGRDFDRSGVRSSLVGRERELGALEDALAALAAGQGGICCVVAEAGLGKSRLVAEVRDRFAGRLTWIEARSLAHGAGLPYHALRNAFRLLLDITPETPAEEGVARIRRAVAAGDAEAGRGLPPLWPHLVAMQGYPLPADPAATRLARMDGAARNAELIRLLREHWRRVARQGATTLVFEDMHWADPDTIQVVRGLLPLAAEVPLQIVLLYRPETEGPLAALRPEVEVHSRSRVLRLEPLSPEHSHEMVVQLLDRYHLPTDLYTRLLEKAEGNPFYLEEVTRALLDSGLVGAEGGLWVRLRSVADLDVPDTLLGLLATRVDRLPAALKTVLQRAAVVGRHFRAADLAPLVDNPAALPGWLADLAGHALLKPDTGSVDGSEYAFRHALIQDVAYGSLLREQRRAMHRLVAGHLDPRTAESGLLAYHYERAEDWPNALHWLAAAAHDADARHANLTALDLVERALAAWERVYPPSDVSADARGRQIALYELLAAVALGLSDREALDRAAGGLLAAGAALGDPTAQVHGYLTATHIDHLDSDWAAWETHVTRALALAEAAANSILLSEVYVRQARLYTNREGPHAAIPSLRRSAALSYLAGDRHELATAANNLSLGYGATGETRRAAWYAAYALKLSHQLGDPRLSAVAHLSGGRIALLRGRLAAGLESMLAGQAEADRSGQVRPQILTRAYVSMAYSALGLYDRALPPADEAARLIADHGAPDLLGLVAAMRVDALLGQGRPGDARAQIADLRAGRSPQQLGQWLAPLLWRQSLLDWLADRPAAARATLRDADAALPHLPCDVPAYTVWAAACLALGDLAEAAARAAQALRWLDAAGNVLDAPFACTIAAHVYAAQGQDAAAAALRTRAQESFQAQCAALPDPAWQQAFAARWAPYLGGALAGDS